jgi:hypothetical protein
VCHRIVDPIDGLVTFTQNMGWRIWLGHAWLGLAPHTWPPSLGMLLFLEMNGFLISFGLAQREPLTSGWVANAFFYSTKLEATMSDKYIKCN